MESISRISSLLETARDLTLEAARDAGPRKSTRPLPAQQIKKLLDSKHEREVLDGLRRVIAMQYAHPPQPTLTYFPAVLKTLSNPYPSTRPLVYNYLIHHAELDPDTALLSINTIQKTLSDSNPRMRAMALKTMSGIRVPVISQIVSLAIKKGVSDLSPIVRKAAALACVKCIRLDPSTRPQVEEYIATLLTDKQYYVAGAAIQAFMELCPERLDLIHPVYRRLCKMVVDMDEWSQLSFLRLMTTYARKCFPRRTKRVKRAAATQADRAKSFYEDIDPEDDGGGAYEEIELNDADLDLLLKSIRPLLSSRNSAVIVAVTKAYLYLSPTHYLDQAVGSIVALLRSPQDIKEVALYNIVQVCLAEPSKFVHYFRHFLIHATEAPDIWRLKLEILTLIFPYCNKDVQGLLLVELEHFSRGHDSDLVRESVRAIGRCAQSPDSSTSRRCLSLLLKQLHSTDQNLVGEAMEVVRHLIQRSPDEHRKTIIRLAKNLDTLTSPTARASIIWLVGEFSGHEIENNIAADVLRILLKGYADETDEVRAQIVLLGAKVYLHHLNAKNAKQKALDVLNPPQHHESQVLTLTEDDEDDLGFRDPSTLTPVPKEEVSTHPLETLYRHTMLLARYTSSYDLRDRSRLFRSLLAVDSSTDLASLLLLAPKPVPQAPSPAETRREFALGSASLVLGSAVRGYEAVPDWVEAGAEPDPKLRDVEGNASAEYAGDGGGDAAPQVAAGRKLDEAFFADRGSRAAAGAAAAVMTQGSKGKAKTLDAWLDEEGSSDGESEEGEDDSGEGSDGSEVEEEDSSEEEETGSEEEEDDEDDDDVDEKGRLMK